MKKNLYYRMMTKRQNFIRDAILGTLSFFASYARMIIEVFVRKDFGRRYFILATTIPVIAFLVLFPMSRFSPMTIVSFDNHIDGRSYFTWYVFLAVFLLFSVFHHFDQTNKPRFDYAEFSLSRGKFASKRLIRWATRKGELNHRYMETFVEPATFFVIGLGLWILGQKLGNLLMVCAVIYSANYTLSYLAGDEFLHDKIDEAISNSEMEKIFSNIPHPEILSGFKFYGRRPASPEMRERLRPSLFEGEDDPEEKIEVK